MNQRRSVRQWVGATLVAVGAFAGLIWVLFVVQPGQVPTAGNAALTFIGHLGPPSTDVSVAHGMLCRGEQERLLHDGFVASGGDDYAVLGGAGARGSGAEHSPLETLEGGVQSTWVEYDIGPVEDLSTWRLYMLRERRWWQTKGNWKVCGIERRS